MRYGSCHGAKKHSWVRITLQTFHIMGHTTIPAAHCLGVIPRFKGLTGKDYQQLPFSVELVINQTTHFRFFFSFLSYPGAHAPAKIWMASTKLFKSDPLRTNGFSPSPQKQGTLKEPLQGSERSQEISAPSISFVAGFSWALTQTKQWPCTTWQRTTSAYPLIRLKKW